MMGNERKIIRAGALAGMIALSAVSAPSLVEAQTGPINTEAPIPNALEGIEGNPLQLKPGLTPELFGAMGGYQASLFDSTTSRVRTYEAPPKEGTDGISPELTIGFINYYLNATQPLMPEDFNWEKVSTPESENEGVYMSVSTSDSPKLDQIAIPGTFGAISVYGPKGIAENYIQFRIPDVEIPDLAPDDDFFNLMLSTLNIPDGEYLKGAMDLALRDYTDQDSTQTYIENYKFIITSNGATAMVVLLNRFGEIHMLETSTENLSTTTGIDLKTELNSDE